MNILFADTFYYIALLSQADAAHERAKTFTVGYVGRMVTTQWVMTEVADALAAPRNRRAFIELLNTLNSDKDVTIIPADAASFHEGLKLYSTRHDKNWSLTDCISFVAMRREGINEALTGDHNFEQAGFTALLA